jgi:hypothetical protein
MERHHRKIVWHEKFRVLDEKLAQDADHVEARVFEYYTRPDNVICTHGYSQLEPINEPTNLPKITISKTYAEHTFSKIVIQ